MRQVTLLAATLALAALLFAPAAPAADAWPRWRGPLDRGVGPDADPPVRWSETENVRWKVEVPGRGSATPIVWDDLVFVTSAVAVGEEQSDLTEQEFEFVVIAFDRTDGSVVWKRVAERARPHEGTHQDGTLASNSAVTDGKRVYAYFGSRGIFAYSLDGELAWSQDLGDMTTRLSFGEGSSPALHGDTLVVNWDHEGSSFIVALDARDGSELWRRERDEDTSWATPVIVEAESGPQVVTSATNQVRAYDLASGELLWQSSGMTLNTIPSPVYADGLIYVMSGFRGNALQAIRLADAKGDARESGAIVWEHAQDTPYVPSPLLYDGVLYFLKGNAAVLSAFDAKSGKEIYARVRLEGLTNVYASPVGAAGRVYVTDRKGSTVVLRAGAEPEVLATNELDDAFDASPAVVGKELFLRGKNLYCIAAPDA